MRKEEQGHVLILDSSENVRWRKIALVKSQGTTPYHSLPVSFPDPVSFPKYKLQTVWRPTLASEYFEKKGLLRMEKQEFKEFNELQWEKYVQKALSKLKLQEDDISSSSYSTSWKLAIASHLKRNSAVPNVWLSARLNMGVPNAVSNNCGRYQRETESGCKFARRLKNMKYEH